MRRTDYFLMCLQTYLQARTHSALTPERIVAILDEGSVLPEEALSSVPKLGAAAIEFARFHLNDTTGPHGKEPPPWLAEWEEAQSNRVQVLRNTRNFADSFWMMAEEALADSAEGKGMPFPKGMEPLVTGRAKGMVVSQQDANVFRAWVEAIPGAEQQPFLYGEAPRA